MSKEAAVLYQAHHATSRDQDHPNSSAANMPATQPLEAHKSASQHPLIRKITSQEGLQRPEVHMPKLKQPRLYQERSGDKNMHGSDGKKESCRCKES
ncbi:hypothetical protein DPMN_110268 [Dreissena polymorpha]|uniref:Uncharacterized protein n=1 Tax=Dreissena polymorpha TaxID=45954 RepID=A0A9D4KCN7_DREPO|nr:hypothetical protein DPMN_110268 [Dreissena polymorpha]